MGTFGVFGVLVAACGGGSDAPGLSDNATTDVPAGADNSADTETTVGTVTTTTALLDVPVGGPTGDPATWTAEALISIDLEGTQLDGPDEVGYANSSVWVTVLADFDAEPATEVQQFDPGSGELLMRVPVTRSGELAVGGDALWVSTEGGVFRGGSEPVDEAIARVDVATGETRYVDIGNGAVAADGDLIWVYVDDGIFRLDPATGGVVAELGAVSYAMLEGALGEIVVDLLGEDDGGPGFVLINDEIGIGGGLLWTAQEPFRDVPAIAIAYDATTGDASAVIPLERPGDPEIDSILDIAAGAGLVWILVELEDETAVLYGIDAVDLEVAASVAVEVEDGATLWEIDGDDRFVYALDDHQTMHVIDADGIAATITLPTEFTQDLAVGGGAVWVTDLDSETVIRVGP